MALCCCFCLFSNVLANSCVTGVRVSTELEVVTTDWTDDMASDLTGTEGFVNNEFPTSGDMRCCWSGDLEVGIFRMVAAGTFMWSGFATFNTVISR